MRKKWFQFLFALWLWMSLFPGTHCYCNNRELQAFTHGIHTYKSHGYAFYSKGKKGGYSKNEQCEVLFKASYTMDVIKIEVIDTDMQERYRGRCLDKVILYDGPTLDSPILKEFCGQETPIVESTSDEVLLVFETDNHDSRNYRGFKLKYSSIDKGGYDAYKSQNSSVSVGTIVASVIPAILVCCLIMVIVYKRCKYAQRGRRNLAATGHPPEDLRVAMATMLDQVSRGQLNTSRQGPNGLQEGHTNLMDQTATRCSDEPPSNGRTGGAPRGRVRHPAGDIRTDESANVPVQQHFVTELPDNESAVPFLGPEGSDPINGYLCHPYSNNNITANNNTAANLNYQGFYPEYPPDPTGIFYAGDVDEHGMLHPPDGGLPFYPAPGSIPTTSIPIYISHPHLEVEEDRRSRSSGQRSPHGSERNSPRGRNSPSHSHRSRASSAGHRSGHLPHRHHHRHHNHPNHVHHSSLNQLDAEGSTLTFYGMVDGDHSASGHTHSATDCSDIPQQTEPRPVAPPSNEEFPPPSYEEAATGKYSPWPKR